MSASSSSDEPNTFLRDLGAACTAAGFKAVEARGRAVPAKLTTCEIQFTGVDFLPQVRITATVRIWAGYTGTPASQARLAGAARSVIAHIMERTSAVMISCTTSVESNPAGGDGPPMQVADISVRES